MICLTNATMDAASKYPTGDFSFLQLEFKVGHQWRVMIEVEELWFTGAYTTITRENAWTAFDFIRTPTETLATHPRLASVTEEILRTMPDNGRGADAILEFTLNVMWAIRNNGWNEYVKTRLGHILHDL